jgi:hypothetical protein
MPLSDGIRPRRFPVVNVLIIGVMSVSALVRAGKELNVGARRGRLRLAT